jgi:hypothetical protein
MIRIARLPYVVALTLLVGGAGTAFGDTRTWDGSVSADWFTAGNWAEDAVPVAGDVVTIAAGTALLTNSTPSLTSLSLTGTLVFSNWNTTLSATNVMINSGGIATLPPAYTSTAMSNNVVVVCSNLTVATGGKIDVDGKGYAGGARFSTSPAGDGHGPGRGIGNAYGVGASHGGRGGGSVSVYPNAVYPGASPYDVVASPQLPGSGGGGSATASGGLYDGGAGGGAVRINATGAVAVEGAIMANGASGAGAGSGGSIYIVCRTFTGGGSVSVRGGAGYPYHNGGGHGGGGCIAIDYNLEAQPEGLSASLLASPSGSLAGNYGSASTRGDFGTIWLRDDRFFGTVIGSTVSGRIFGFDALTRDALTVNNTWIRFAEEGFALTVANDLTVSGAAGMLQVGGGARLAVYQYEPRYATIDAWYGPVTAGGTVPPVVTVGGNLTLSGGGALALYSAATNSVAPTHGALLDVAGRVSIASTSALYPYSHPTNGGSVRLEAKSVMVAAGGRINGNGKGFAGAPGSGRSFGPGSVEYAYYAPGGGHGGIGGSSYSITFGGSSYGSDETPVLPGSGGGRIQAAGGSAIIIETEEGITVNGEVLAGGMFAGAGGSINLLCGTFAGTNGLLNAAGSNADAHHGAGGGGRISVRFDTAQQSPQAVSKMRYTVAGGAASTERPSADSGTLWFSDSRFLGETLTGLWGKLSWLDTWTVPSLTITNASVRFMADGFRLAVANNLVIGMGGVLELGGPIDNTNKVALSFTTPAARLRPYPHGLVKPPELLVGGNLTLTNGGLLAVYSAVSPQVGNESGLGARVEVAKDVRIAANSWIHPYAHPTNGAAPLLRMNRLRIDAGGGINADAKGYSGALRINNVNLTVTGYGPGKGTASAYPNGAGYGGLGGNNTYANGRGATYGVRETPFYPGSGGGASSTGGGLIRLEVARTFDLAGTLTANAITVYGAAAGGGIYVRCGTFIGRDTAVLSAKGGNSTAGHSGAGGGGRIAVWRLAGAEIPVLVSKGTNVENAEFRETYRADDGTFFWDWLPPPGSVFVIR